MFLMLNNAGFTTDNQRLGDELRKHLEVVRSLRQAQASDAIPQHYHALKEWQSSRLAKTYPDLLDSPRYRPAAEFFLSELYGAKDFTARDAEVARIIPTLVAMLPARALHTLAEAIRMDALSESLDITMVKQIRSTGWPKRIDDTTYAAAYRACGRREDRTAQITLVAEIGTTLDRLTHMRMLSVSLRVMKAPAEMAGLGNLHQFLWHGFEAFRHMHGAEHFLATINEREFELMNRLFETR